MLSKKLVTTNSAFLMVNPWALANASISWDLFIERISSDVSGNKRDYNFFDHDNDFNPKCKKN
jgi:hypothetical protein